VDTSEGRAKQSCFSSSSSNCSKFAQKRSPNGDFYVTLLTMFTYLFLFAHPDDETIGCAGTIRKLVDMGERVIVISATAGDAGELHGKAQERFKKLGSVKAVREEEFYGVTKFLGVNEAKILQFADGEITNKTVWGELTTTFIDLINSYKPDFVITFDHTGWYYHLDHVGVSIAATTAYHQATHRPQALLLSHIQTRGKKWNYIFAEKLPITHVYEIEHYKKVKADAIDFHPSQHGSTTILELQEKLRQGEVHEELYQLGFASEKGKKLLENHPVFKKVSR
jgi:LmbE family N-acetylglucosaminyl deacetylase